MENNSGKLSPLLLRVLANQKTPKPPIWLMRQAGRYLPEYRAIRAKAPSFLDFCYSPKLATEATLQPIRRFGFDAAILFSDILVVPDALGQKVTFETGEGPKLDPIDTPERFSSLCENPDLNHLAPVFETIEMVRSQLPRETALIGFCGAPWTVASYMVAGKGTPDQAPARIFAYKYPSTFSKIIDKITDYSILYLIEQFKSGVDAVQIFDSWSGVLPTMEFEKWCFKPLERIIRGVRSQIPNAPIIAFPRGAALHLEKVASIDGLAAIALDTSIVPAWAARHIQSRMPVQGNLDPLVLLAGGHQLETHVKFILESFSNGPHIFNLGHGILPATPVEHVEKLLRFIRG